MDGEFGTLTRYADREFFGDNRGRSVNGIAFLPLLRSMTLDQIISEDTFEGYSVWEIACHVAYCKYYFAKNAGLGELVYPYEVGLEGFASPKDRSQKGWEDFLNTLENFHTKAMKTVESIGNERRNEKLGDWSMNIGDSVVWLCAHDTYHTAQIKNMAVPGLKQKKLVF